MSEPISKKSGFEFRKARAKKNEEFKGVMTRTRNIQSFFNVGKRIDKDQCDGNENKSSIYENLVDAAVGEQIGMEFLNFRSLEAASINFTVLSS